VDRWISFKKGGKARSELQVQEELAMVKFCEERSRHHQVKKGASFGS
jgi:hypothetical protein